MVRTRAQEHMDRAYLDKLTQEQLQEEATKYGLSTEGNWNTLIDAIMSHLEHHGPVEELLRGASGSQQPTGITKKLAKTLPARRESQEAADVLRQMLTAIQQQQQQLGQILQLLAEQRAEGPERQQQASVARATAESTPPRASPADEGGRRSTES